jgi:myo-inositol-1(or 4)-monophosphatase
VSIGYLERGVPTLGAIYDPSHDWLYSAAKGEGAWLDGTRMAVSPIAEMDAATVECGWSTRRTTGDYIALLSRVMACGCAIRRAGLRCAGVDRRRGGTSRGVLRIAHQRVGLRGGDRDRAGAGGFANAFFGANGEGIADGNPLIATNAALRDELAGIIGIAVAR